MDRCRGNKADSKCPQLWCNRLWPGRRPRIPGVVVASAENEGVASSPRFDRRRTRLAEPGELNDGGWSLKSGWRWFAALVADYHWYILFVAGVIAFTLGCIGWAKVLPEADPNNRPILFTDLAYWSFKDFLMNSPGQPDLPWQLDVARFLAPLVAGWAGYSALASLFRDRIQQMRIP